MKVVDREDLFKGILLVMRKKIVQNKDGTLWERETVGYGKDAVAIVGIENGRIYFVRQFRPACEDSLVEIPAGRVEENETPQQCAKREFEEETGLVPLNLRKIIEFYPSPGFVEEKIHLFLCSEFQKGNVNLDKGEEVETLTLTLEEALDFINSGQIVDAKTIIGILLMKVMT